MIDFDYLEDLLNAFKKRFEQIDGYATTSWKLQVKEKQKIQIRCCPQTRSLVDAIDCNPVLTGFNMDHKPKLILESYMRFEDDDRYVVVQWDLITYEGASQIPFMEYNNEDVGPPEMYLGNDLEDRYRDANGDNFSDADPGL